MRDALVAETDKQLPVFCHPHYLTVVVATLRLSFCIIDNFPVSIADNILRKHPCFVWDYLLTVDYRITVLRRPVRSQIVYNVSGLVGSRLAVSFCRCSASREVFAVSLFRSFFLCCSKRSSHFRFFAANFTRSISVQSRAVPLDICPKILYIFLEVNISYGILRIGRRTPSEKVLASFFVIIQQSAINRSI